jgi:hypothetical protein
MADAEEDSISVTESEDTQSASQNDEDYWDVKEILAEKGEKYRVDWVWDGVSNNGVPWKPSWVPKQDCTEHLVHLWNEKKKLKRKEAARKRQGEI